MRPDCLFHYDSPLGGITLSAGGEALTGLWFDGQKYFGHGLNGPCTEKWLPVFGEAERWLDLFFDGRDPGFIPRISLRTTGFRAKVLEVLLTVPYGERITYGEIAARLAAQPGAGRVSARAVGSAVGHNPISLIIPCHRVVGAGGRLTGYAGGTERKEILLQTEQAGLRRNEIRDLYREHCGNKTERIKTRI